MGLCPDPVTRLKHVRLIRGAEGLGSWGCPMPEAQPPAKAPFRASYFVVSPSNNSSGRNQCNPSLSSFPGHAERLLCRPCQSFCPQSKALAGSGFP